MFAEGGSDEGSGNKIEFIGQPASLSRGGECFYRVYNAGVSYWIIGGF